MLVFKRGDMFTTSAQALVVAVNCVGVMGAGQAKQFAQHYPNAAKQYREDCATGNMRPGDVWDIHQGTEDKSLFAAATKLHWKDPSKTLWVYQCVKAIHHIMIQDFDVYGLNSIAVPRLGCGLGGIEWKDIEPTFQAYFEATDYLVEIWTH